MSYEASIQNESQFQQGARGRRNFSQLYQDQGWEADAINWGTQELFAARAICMPEQSLMTPLSDFYPDTFNPDAADPHIASFYVGYENMDDLPWQSEVALVQANEAVGGIWAALGDLLRKEQFALGVYGPNQAPAIQAQENIHITQSPLSHTVGEFATVHLARSVVRLILIYKQDITGARLLSWRVPRFIYRYRGGSHVVSVMDNGGIDMPVSGNLEQIASLEAKRSLDIVNGEPHVSDEVLAQMVGQAIAMQRCSSGYIAACGNMSVTILATTTFMRFYVFQFSDAYFQDNMYENLALGANGCHMRIYPTKWLDIRKREHRQDIILHVYALLEWASSLP